MKLYAVTPAASGTNDELLFTVTAKCEFCTSEYAVTPTGTELGTPLNHAQIELLEGELEDAECDECHCSSNGKTAFNVRAKKGTRV